MLSLLMTTAKQGPPKTSRRLRTRWALSVVGLQGEERVKRERWTESDIVALALEEPDIFERKSGQLLDDMGKFLDTAAKALSAFANSGGGHLILGVEDDGALTGLNPLMGKEPMRDWLEQKIPTLLDYSLSDFRVHTAEPASTSAIPAGKIIIVIDVGDSSLAPHQSKRDKFYYHRVGGRSVPAPHFYLDLLRQRLANPHLEFTLDQVIVDGAEKYDRGIFVALKFRFTIQNRGRVAAYKWGLTPKIMYHPDDEIFPHIFFGRPNFPVMRNGPGGISIDDTILPDHNRDYTSDVGITLRPSGHSEDDIESALEYALRELSIVYQLATETSPGDPITLKPIDKLDINKSVEKILAAIAPEGQP